MRGAYLALYGAVAVLLAFHGANYLLLLVRRAPSADAPPARRAARDAPHVTVQVPAYNESAVLPRMLDALAALEWPRERLDVQVLDDSDDGSRPENAHLLDAYRDRLDVAHVVGDRTDYKAGALRRGHAQARGEFVAMFDADFVPPPDFLQRALDAFDDERLACVQARWAHANADENAVTRALALGLDAHFLVEQEARSARGHMLSFSGTAAVWRKAAIDDAGGWSGDTLAEDLDLSCAALERGWRFRQLASPACPQELPADADTFRRQQARWARGSIQCARKHAARLLRARAPRATRAEAVFHVLHYTIHPLVFLLFVLLLGSLVLGAHPRWMDALVALSVLGPLGMFVATARRTRFARLRHLPLLVLLGLGISWSSTRAIVAGLFRRGVFERTPKRGDRQPPAPPTVRGRRWSEPALALLAVAAAPPLYAAQGPAAAANACIFAAAFASVALLGRTQRKRSSAPAGVPHA